MSKPSNQLRRNGVLFPLPSFEHFEQATEAVRRNVDHLNKLLRMAEGWPEQGLSKEGRAFMAHLLMGLYTEHINLAGKLSGIASWIPKDMALLREKKLLALKIAATTYHEVALKLTRQILLKVVKAIRPQSPFLIVHGQECFSSQITFPDQDFCINEADKILLVLATFRDDLSNAIAEENLPILEGAFAELQQIFQRYFAAEGPSEIGPSRSPETIEGVLIGSAAIKRNHYFAPNTNDPAKKPKRSTERGEGRAKIIAALTAHHKYADGGCLNLEPIGNNELARKAHVSESTVSTFFKDKFKGHTKYRVLCRDQSGLVASLKLLNQEFSPHELYGARPPEKVERDRETGE